MVVVTWRNDGGGPGSRPPDDESVPNTEARSPNSHGRPRQPLPTTTPSQPVTRIRRRASHGSHTSPFPKTGMVATAAFRSATAVQSASPEYNCSAVRAWSDTADAPTASAIRPASRNVRWSSSVPFRNFTVTGTSPERSTAARTMASNRRGFNGMAAPPPRRVTLGIGQPKFMSTWSTRPSPTSMSTARPMLSGSVPYSWMLRGDSSGAKWARRVVLRWPSTRPRAVTISLTYRPAPNSRHMVRNGALVTPAIGARTTGGHTSSGPMRGTANSPGVASWTSLFTSLRRPMGSRLRADRR